VKKGSIIGWLVRITILLLGTASAVGIYHSVLSVKSSIRVQKQYPTETLGLTISTASTIILSTYILFIVLALITSQTVLYRTVAILTFVFGIIMMFPTAVIGMGYPSGVQGKLKIVLHDVSGTLIRALGTIERRGYDSSPVYGGSTAKRGWGERRRAER